MKHQSGPTPDPTTTKLIIAGYRRMIAALLKNSLQAAKSGDREAAEFLRSDGLLWLDYLGFRNPGAGVERLLDPPGKIIIRIFGGD